MAASLPDGLIEVLVRHASGGRSEAAEGVAVNDLAGGFVSPSVRRIDLSLGGAGGAASYVLKACPPGEIAMMQAAAGLGAASFPACVASGDGWFAMPFFPGPDLTFGDPAPLSVVEDLARLHAVWEGGEAPAWAWTFDAAYLDRLRGNAIVALDSSRFDTPAALRALHPGSPLIAQTNRLTRTLVHGDVHAGNIIAGPRGRFTLIDWGNACRAPAMLDTANMIPLGSAPWSAYLAAYRHAGGAQAEAALVRAWRWARGATGLMYLPWAAAHRDDVSGLTEQVLDADAALAAPGGGPLP